MAEKAHAGELLHQELRHLKEELDTMAQKGTLPPSLKDLHRDLSTLPIEPGATETQARSA